MKVFGSVPITNGKTEQASLKVKEGDSLNITCQSDLHSLTLEYDSVVHRQTHNDSGTYTVKVSKTADKDDEYKLVICKATNATGQQMEDSAYVRVTGE